MLKILKNKQIKINVGTIELLKKKENRHRLFFICLAFYCLSVAVLTFIVCLCISHTSTDKLQTLCDWAHQKLVLKAGVSINSSEKSSE